jgi:Flp pilus assembly pilin Flp
VSVEYVVILSLVAVGLATAVVGLGPVLVRAYLAREAWLLLPFP